MLEVPAYVGIRYAQEELVEVEYTCQGPVEPDGVTRAFPEFLAACGSKERCRDAKTFLRDVFILGRQRCRLAAVGSAIDKIDTSHDIAPLIRATNLYGTTGVLM